MIYSLRGIVSHIDNNIAIIECNNIGYICNVSNHTLNGLTLGSESYLYAHMIIRQDDINLYGFLSKEELNMFKLLINVSGVGPKCGISILSSLTPELLINAIQLEDYEVIKVCQGVGAKVSKRIILELKDKVNDLDQNKLGSSSETVNKNSLSLVALEAMEALESLGYIKSEIYKVVRKYDVDSNSIEDIVKGALKELR